ncbi:DEAD/DEAH box helicase family protein [Massilia sp. PAMC28688]|uniref:DEAD/DEAH box helicase family protein n=1 Tax=Massilia sp. PAMC28688 TaxID=2861283 RepID=UPI001C6375E1|nr:DEAD/DEAH box helicase family protein [Massilia sp. PAMC28688]QYF93057.1 DEAD/DEAH box helicase family protein [Massilia sp. PAMC28688]
MINFGKLGKAKATAVAGSLIELFEQLDRKATHQILRPVQHEALQGLQKHGEEVDVVLKVSTGSGKTLVGLVYAESMRRRYPGEPVVYLCPTVQLIGQVLETAEKIGVSATSFPKDGFPFDALEGKSVLVCTYDKVFTANDVFTRHNIQPAAIVMDDVHSGVERIKQKHTVTLPADAHGRVRNIFEATAVNCDPAVWRGIQKGDGSAQFEVPFWLWQPQAAHVAAVLAQFGEERELRFTWRNIERYLEDARLCISGSAVELSLPVAPVEQKGAYASARHRLFMSASIKDGTALIRDLDCNPKALDRVIQPESDKGAGERMILPVSLIDPTLSKQAVATLCMKLAERTNVVVLTSSAAQAKIWQAAGATAWIGDDVDTAVGVLRTSAKGHFYVFTQRFDGVDLPDDACRLLVIDGVPSGDRLCDQIDAERLKESPSHATRVVNRLEQALGRAVRSSADFAAVLLVGTDLAAFIGRRDVKTLMEPHTREQIELGKDIADQLKEGGSSIDAIAMAVTSLLDREQDWKDAHRERVGAVAKSIRIPGLTITEQAAVAERRSWLAAKARNHQQATSALQEILDKQGLHDAQRAELLVRMAGYAAHFDQARAGSLYRVAFEINSQMARPPQLPDKKYVQLKEQAVLFSEAIDKFDTPAAAVAALESLRARLAYAGDAQVVEQALYELGRFIGATASRPEKETGRGPDVLWLVDGLGLCIEAKNEKIAPIHKSDAEQLLMSTQWCTNEARISADSVIPVFATNSMMADRAEDIGFGPRVLAEIKIMDLIDRLIALVNAISFAGPLFRDPADIGRRLAAAGVTGRAIAASLNVLKANG